MIHTLDTGCDTISQEKHGKTNVYKNLDRTHQRGGQKDSFSCDEDPVPIMVSTKKKNHYIVRIERESFTSS